MILSDWAERWGIPPQALQELAAVQTVSATEDFSEAGVQSRVRLEAAELGHHLWRNNMGAGKLAESGRFVRFGLANDSEKLNAVLKSGDLIGLQKTLITQDMVGAYVGKFTSRECKPSDWKYKGTEREQAQLRWCTLINLQGGDAKIVCGPGSFT